MTCQHELPGSKPCGRPAVALWVSPIHGNWAFCVIHDRSAERITRQSWLHEWTRKPLPATVPA